MARRPAINDTGLKSGWHFGVADPTLVARMRLHSTIAHIGWAVWASIQLRVSSREIDFARIREAYWDQARAMLDSEEFPD